MQLDIILWVLTIAMVVMTTAMIVVWLKLGWDNFFK